MGDWAVFTIKYDSVERSENLHPLLLEALSYNKKTEEKFESITPSEQNEIKRYINNLKNLSSVSGNVKKFWNY